MRVKKRDLSFVSRFKYKLHSKNVIKNCENPWNAGTLIMNLIGRCIIHANNPEIRDEPKEKFCVCYEYGRRINKILRGRWMSFMWSCAQLLSRDLMLLF